jgi:hypothetical protein
MEHKPYKSFGIQRRSGLYRAPIVSPNYKLVLRSINRHIGSILSLFPLPTGLRWTRQLPTPRHALSPNDNQPSPIEPEASPIAQDETEANPPALPPPPTEEAAPTPSPPPKVSEGGLSSRLKDLFHLLKNSLSLSLASLDRWYLKLLALALLSASLLSSLLNFALVPIVNTRVLPSAASKATEVLQRSVKLGQVKQVSLLGLTGTLPLVSLGPLYVGEGPVEASRVYAPNAQVFVDPIKSLILRQVSFRVSETLFSLFSLLMMMMMMMAHLHICLLSYIASSRVP